MKLSEEEFLKKLRATFRIEAQEHVQEISSRLLALEKAAHPEQRAEHLEVTFRHAHSLKGAARAVNLGEIESICQTLEEVFSTWKERNTPTDTEALDKVHAALDVISRLLAADSTEASEQETPRISTVLQRLNELISLSPIGAAGAENSPPLTQSDEGSVRVKPEPGAPDDPPVQPHTDRATIAETIRVSTAKLDHLLLEAEEMLSVKQTTAQRTTEFRELSALFDDWNKQWSNFQAHSSKDRHGRPLGDIESSDEARFLDWNSAFVKSLQAKLLLLNKAIAQDQQTVAKLVDDLLADSKTLLMLPFSTLADIFPKIVRDLSRDEGKEVDLTMRGIEMEVDKRILEEMKDPLIHLLRNCIDHGIEKLEERREQNKPIRASVGVLVAAVNGNKVEIVVSDDGRGIDSQRVKESAVRKGILSAAEAERIAHNQAIDLVFHPHVSTSPLITELSGRGLGLSIVREKAAKLGGSVSIETQRNVGTKFRILLPLTLATFRGILLRVAEQVFVIPTFNVERVMRIKRSNIKTVENRETAPLGDGTVVSIVRMHDVLEMAVSQRTNDFSSQFFTAIVVSAGSERIAFLVDEVMSEQEVLVKTLSKPLSRVRNIAAATVLPSGRAILILNVADLMKSARKAGMAANHESTKVPPVQKGKSKKILVAEDSITSRTLLKGILESAGYQVKTAVDGVDALTVLRSEDFDAVVSDVEMPRMNGFDLTTQIRKDKRLAEMPVVLVTALASSDDRERGIDVGASAYIVKSSFDQSNLIEVIGRLV